MVPTDHSSTVKASVEFYPTLEDFVHISLRIGEEATASAFSTRIYQAFLVLNAIGFPAFLLFNELYLAGILLFVVNFALLILIVPRVNSDAATKYYKNVMGNREKEIARVDLSDDGILYTSDEGVAFWPWRRIRSMEETETSIFFYFEGNGIAIQKTGFTYQEDQQVFLRFAKAQIHPAGSREIESGEEK
jgi:hypothetical protein